MRAIRLGTATAVIAIGLVSGTGALAQSTGSQSIEEIVVTGTRAKSQGIIVAEQTPKSRSTIDQEYISAKNSGQSILETLNLTPGYNFVNNDPYGNSGGNLRLRGFDGNRIALLQDGIPLNDSGNYAIFSNQQLDSELIERAVVNLGTTDVDSPTASATGGTINYITRKPSEDMSLLAQASLGENRYRRGIAVFNTGSFGPWDTRAFFSASYTKYDKFKGPGTLQKTQLNGRIYQSIGDNGDFISILGHYNRNRNNFYRNLRLSEFQTNPNIDRVDACARPTPAAGTAQTELGTNPCTGTAIGVDSGYFNLFINPSNTGNVRGQSKFTVTEGVTLTIDPSFQYVLANGGGNEVVFEKDQRLQGTRFNPATALALQPGVDLNGDGDFLDNVRLYRPNNTNTRRYGVNASLIWNIDANNLLRFAYTYDRARHRQTGEFTFLDVRGNTTNVFGGRNGIAINTLDGNVFQTRDRLSIALLNQFAGEYRGEFFDNFLTVSLGLRAPYFKRELNQFCFTNSGGFAYCSNQAVGTISVFNPAAPAAAFNNARAPFTGTVKYDKLLPNVGLSIQPGEGHMLFAGYSKNLSSPRTDDLYDIQIVNARPETTELYEAGYRYQRGRVLASIGGYTSTFKNRLVRAFDQDLGINITRNVGAVDSIGFDGQIGFRVIPSVTLYGSYSFNDTELQEDLVFGRNGAGVATLLPTKGKELVETPKHQWGLRADYSGEAFSAGIEIKHVGDRFSTDVNDQVSPKYEVVNFNARYKLDSWGFKGAYFQVNATNLFGEKYLGNISTATNSVAITATNGNVIAAGNPTFSVGAPQTFQGTFRFVF